MTEFEIHALAMALLEDMRAYDEKKKEEQENEEKSK